MPRARTYRHDVTQKCKIETTPRCVAADTSLLASENITMVVQVHGSFGNIRKQRAWKKSLSLIRTSELLRNSRGVKRSAARITSVQSLRAADRRHGINHDAGVITGGHLAELAAWFRQNVKHVHSVRPVTKGLVACTMRQAAVGTPLVPNTSRSTNVCECWDDEGSDYVKSTELSR